MCGLNSCFQPQRSGGKASLCPEMTVKLDEVQQQLLQSVDTGPSGL